jgi:ferredoxin
LSYAYPQASALGVTAKTLLSTYARAGGKDAVLLLHSQGKGQAMVNELGRAAQLQRAHGLPSRVIPMSVWHTASVGADVWLSMLAFGAAQVVVLATDEEAPQYAQAVQEQMAQVQAVLHGLGYPGQHLTWLQADSASAMDAQLKALPPAPVRAGPLAKFALTSDKRSSLALALDHWMTHAPAAQTWPEAIALPAAGAFWGGVQVDTQACTLCLSCVSACPASALQDNPEQPELAIIEKNCVQCGLCVTTCPENAIQTVPRLLLTPARQERQVLNQSQPYSCVRCSKPFGTLKAIEAMLGKLSGHAMFQGAAAERLKMCSDCRVIDIYSAGDEQRIV